MEAKVNTPPYHFSVPNKAWQKFAINFISWEFHQQVIGT